MKLALLSLLALLKPPFVRILSSSKFWTAILGLVARGLAKHDIVLPPDMANEIAAAFALLLVGQAATDFGKAKAEVENRHVQSGFISGELLAGMLAVCVLAVGVVASCATLKSEGRQLAAHVVDCTTERALEVAKEYGPSVELALRSQLSDTGQIDRAGMKALAKSFVTDTGRCVLAREVARLLLPRGQDAQSTPLPIDTADVSHAWFDLRHTEFGGQSFDLGGP